MRVRLPSSLLWSLSSDGLEHLLAKQKVAGSSPAGIIRTNERINLMSDPVDLTIPTKTFTVPTSIHKNGRAYMGPEIKINAHDSNDALKRTQEAGYTPNPHFPPKENK